VDVVPRGLFFLSFLHLSAFCASGSLRDRLAGLGRCLAVKSTFIRRFFPHFYRSPPIPPLTQRPPFSAPFSSPSSISRGFCEPYIPPPWVSLSFAPLYFVDVDFPRPHSYQFPFFDPSTQRGHSCWISECGGHALSSVLASLRQFFASSAAEGHVGLYYVFIPFAFGL